MFFFKKTKNFLFLVYVCLLIQPSHLPLFFASLFPTIQPFSSHHGLVVGPSGRLRGILGESAVSRLCGHYAHHFPQLALNAAEPWPFRDFALKIYVKPNSWSQTLFISRLSIGGEKNLTHLNCGQCPPFVCWSSRVGQPSATSQDKTSEEPIQNVIWPPGSIADSQRSNDGNLWGFSFVEFFIHWNVPFWQKSKWQTIFRRFPWWHEVLKKCGPCKYWQ